MFRPLPQEEEQGVLMAHVYPLLPVVLLALTVPVVEVFTRVLSRSVAPRVCEHPWYMDGRCIVCGVPE